MSFSDDWAQCMRSNGMPVITLDNLGEIKEFIENVHQAWENSGGETEMTLAALAAAGAATGLDEAVLEVLGTAAEITVVAYIAGCVSCLAAVGADALRDLFAQNAPQPFLTQQLADLGVKLEGTATA